MSYCFSTQCPQPQNSLGSTVCQACGSALLLQGQYRGLYKLSGGGMSYTFLGVDEVAGDHHPCIIKQFSPQFQTQISTEKALELFHLEAVRLKDLGNHHQIPQFFSNFEQNNYFYLVEEFIPGKTLTQELEDKGYFDEDQIREALENLLEVLQFIHQNHVIHRDIKPDNIIRRETDNQLVLVDFGIAKYSPNLGQPLTGTITGTIGYAPLEQIRGGKVYPASDLYSLGVTCIQLLTHVPPNELFDPFSGELIWRSHLRTIGISISEALDKILDKLIKDIIRERYQSATEVLSDLKTIKTPDQNSSQTTPLQIIINTELEAVKTQFNPHNIVDRPGKSLPENGWHSFPIPSFFHNPSAAPHSPASTLLSSSGQPPNLLTATRPNVTLKNVRKLQGHTETVEAIAIGPKGYILASGGADRTIRLWNLKTGQLLHRFLGHLGTVHTLAMSPNGRRLVSGSLDRTILAWNLHCRTLTDRFFSHSGSPYSHRSGGVQAVSYSPDGRVIASGSADSTIKLWNQRNGELLYRLDEHQDQVLCLTFPYSDCHCMYATEATHPQSSLFASGAADGSIKLWQFGRLSSLYTLKEHSAPVSTLAFSSDCDLLISGSFDTTVKLWNVHTGELLRTLNGHPDAVKAVAISPDGQWLASASQEGTVQLWNLPNPNLWGLPARTLSAYPPVAFTPDSQMLVTGGSSGDLLVWSLEKA
ncbi:MAG: serine/threonine-protein kinase [Microcoleaceae cyanobacterium]